MDVYQTILVVDAMTGQDAVNVSDTFNQKVGIDGVILTKLDGDTRGGAALSIKATCGKPILYVGMGEKLSDLEQFYPDRMASRILGMGDVMSLIEKAQANIDEEKARSMEQKLKKAQFGFDDYLESMEPDEKYGRHEKTAGNASGHGRRSAQADRRCHGRKENGTDRGNDPLHDTEGESKSRPSESFPEEAYRCRSGSGHQ